MAELPLESSVLALAESPLELLVLVSVAPRLVAVLEPVLAAPQLEVALELA